MRWSYTFLIVTIIILAAVILWICHQYLWSELEVHGVIVIPSSAPDETMLLEYQYNLVWDAVGVCNARRLALTRVLPQPVVALGHTNVYRHAV